MIEWINGWINENAFTTRVNESLERLVVDCWVYRCTFYKLDFRNIPANAEMSPQQAKASGGKATGDKEGLDKREASIEHRTMSHPPRENRTGTARVPLDGRAKIASVVVVDMAGSSTQPPLPSYPGLPLGAKLWMKLALRHPLVPPFSNLPSPLFLLHAFLRPRRLQRINTSSTVKCCTTRWQCLQHAVCCAAMPDWRYEEEKSNSEPHWN